MYADENENEFPAEEPEQEAYGEGEPQEEEEWWEEKVEAPPEPEPENAAPGVDANGRRMLPLDYLKKYPLHRAVESGSVEDITLILTMQPSLLNGVTLPLQRTAVVEAARLSNFQVLSCLAKAGADLHKADKFGDNVLHHATRRNIPLAHLQTLVQDFKMRVNVRGHEGKTALHHLSGHGALEPIRWLLEYKGADPTVQDKHGHTPAHYAWTYPLQDAKSLDSKQTYVLQKQEALRALLKRHEVKWSERPQARKTPISTTTHTNTLDHTTHPSLTHKPTPSSTAMGGTQGAGAKAWGTEEGPGGQAAPTHPMQVTSHNALAHTQESSSAPPPVSITTPLPVPDPQPTPHNNTTTTTSATTTTASTRRPSKAATTGGPRKSLMSSGQAVDKARRKPSIASTGPPPTHLASGHAPLKGGAKTAKT